jgi:hypothetical protein
LLSYESHHVLTGSVTEDRAECRRHLVNFLIASDDQQDALSMRIKQSQLFFKQAPIVKPLSLS